MARHLEQAKDIAADLVRLKEDEDQIGLDLEGQKLRGLLRALWGLRKIREDEWAEVVNYLQGALMGEAFESFTMEKCEALRKVIVDHLAMGTVSDHQPRAARKMLEQAGFYPRRPISRRNEDDDNQP
jgi:hypothetical protein